MGTIGVLQNDDKKITERREKKTNKRFPVIITQSSIRYRWNNFKMKLIF